MAATLSAQTVSPRTSLSASIRRRVRVGLRGWQYSGGSRDLRLDALRGFAAIAMIVDHVGGGDSWLYTVTGGDRFFTSGAEFFVLIAGITMGIVYGRLIAKSGFVAAARKALWRGITLYGLTVALTFSFVAVSLLAGAPWRLEMTRAQVLPWALSILTLQSTYYLTDIMLMYSLLMVAAVPALWGLSKGRSVQVLVASWSLWVVWQLVPMYAQIPWPIANNVMFNPAAWQVIFITGLVVGHHLDDIKAWSRPVWPLPALVVMGVLAVLIYASYSAEGAEGALRPGSFIGEQFHGKADVRIGRLLSLAVFFGFGYSLLTVLWTPVMKALGWLLMPLGQHALGAYSIHLFMLAAWAYLMPTWTEIRPAWENALIQASGLGVVLIAIVAKERFDEYRATREERRNAAIAAAAILGSVESRETALAASELVLHPAATAVTGDGSRSTRRIRPRSR